MNYLKLLFLAIISFLTLSIGVAHSPIVWGKKSKDWDPEKISQTQTAEQISAQIKSIDQKAKNVSDNYDTIITLQVQNIRLLKKAIQIKNKREVQEKTIIKVKNYL